ncbi:MAG: hypothetical protein C4521_12235 [Actinobacteria bacterium]|nr:MAG: hypothetical protein C4521_12235 [Actinomycetota bacterium]
MTNSWGDMANSKLVLVQGSNFVENHPGTVQWVNEAIENGSKVVVVDPRKTRTASWAEQRGGSSFKIRPGTDLALTMGLIKYAIDNDKVDWVRTYNFTDAPFLFDAASGVPCNGATGGNNSQCDYLRSADVGVYNGTPAQNTAADKFNSAQCKTACTTGNTVFSYLTTRASHYTAGVVADITGMTVGEFNSLAAMVTDPNNRPGSIYYAMGGTQHSYGSQQLHAYCMLQLILGNMGRNGGGVNALRGIHNVQGSTDMGLLKGLIPGYSAPPSSTQTYVQYMDTLFGSDTGGGLQQVGFRNMLNAFFKQAADPVAALSGTYDRTNSTSQTNANFAYFPKASGDDHITMFQKMKAGTTKALFCFGQNPAVTEPNLSEIRDGLYNLDTLIVSELYMSETATCSRKAGGRTILLPSCAHPEEAGSVTSSARLIYWRYMATPPKDSSKNDLWILLKMAKAIDVAGGFSHIPLSGTFTSRYQQLYGDQYHASLGDNAVPDFSVDTATTHPNGTPKFAGDLVAENINKQMCALNSSAPWGTVWIYAGAYDQTIPAGTSTSRVGTKLASAAAAGATSITAADDVSVAGVKNVAVGAKAYIGNFGTNSSGLNGDGGNWEEVEVTGVTGTTISFTPALSNAHAAGEAFTVHGYWSFDAEDGMISKSRSFYDPAGNNLMPRFAFAWLVNRRVFYNNNPCTAATQPGSVAGGRPGTNYTPQYVTHCQTTCPNRPSALGGNGSCLDPGDAFDVFVAPDKRGRLFVHHNSDVTPIMNTGVYRAYNKLGDTDYPAAGAGGWSDTSSVGYGANRTRFPKHWEPWEAPNATKVADYGRTGRGPTEGTGGWDFNVGTTGTPLLADRNLYPLVLTTWRQCWHFQGGPMTRNVPWLAELDPDPIIEINASDAYTYGVADGDNVYIHTARFNNCGPFKAKVGVGVQSNQNTKQGVVGVPWHWGRQKMGNSSYAALVEGASANEACIDASDGNTNIPESKACLCTITTSPISG